MTETQALLYVIGHGGPGALEGLQPVLSDITPHVCTVREPGTYEMWLQELLRTGLDIGESEGRAMLDAVFALARAEANRNWMQRG